MAAIQNLIQKLFFVEDKKTMWLDLSLFVASFQLSLMQRINMQPF
jgi:hypothetical protein